MIILLWLVGVAVVDAIGDGGVDVEYWNVMMVVVICVDYFDVFLWVGDVCNIGIFVEWLFYDV